MQEPASNQPETGGAEQAATGTTVPPPAPGITYEQLQMLLKSVQEGSLTQATEIAKTIVQEMRKPTAEEEARAAEEAAYRERRKNEMIELAKIEEQRQIKMHGEWCKKPNGQFPLGGQRFSDGKVREICLRCNKVVREYEPGPESMAGGFGNVTEQFMPVQ